MAGRSWPISATLTARSGSVMGARRTLGGRCPWTSIYEIKVLWRFCLVAKAAQHVAHQIAHRRTRQDGERQRPHHVDCGEAQARGEETVEQALAEPRRQFAGDAVAEHLLNE